MKQFAIVSMLLICFAATAFGQQKVKKKDVVGTWEMVITDLEKTKDDYKDDSEDSKSDSASDRFGEAIESAVNAFVSDLLGDMKFEFTFEKDHSAKLKIHVMGETEIESMKWHINEDGALVIEDADDEDNDHIEVDDVWMLKDGHLVQVDADGKIDEEVYLKRVGK